MNDKLEIPNDEVSCPFCGEKGFDLIGLKSHFTNGDCEKYNEIESIERLFRK